MSDIHKTKVETDSEYEPKMDYDISIISRKFIPKEIYLCDNEKDQEWKAIHLYHFDNGFKYVIGSNDYIDEFSKCVNNLKMDYECVKEVNSASELQEYYYENFDNFMKYENCEKIYNYYKKWSNEIEEIINYYDTE